MKIRMYNVGFGDCFCIRDKGKNLLVDFGTSNGKICGRLRREVFDTILSDLSAIEQKNLLLTHFHLDHLSGLLYMMKKKKSGDEFGKLYLPDVFSTKEMSRTLSLMLLADLMKDTYLPSRQVSLFALVEALCRKPQNVELLERGSLFEGKYRALWPDREISAGETEEILGRIEERYREILERLTAFSDQLRRIVYSMTEPGRQNQEEVSRNLNALDREFREIRARAEFQQLLGTMEEQKIELRQFKNKISVVFHNDRDGELNLLFTGDVEKKHMKMIREDYDGRLPLHEHYWCIKVPHHGTEGYYCDFSEYTPENLLISNGVYYANSKKRAKMYRTSARYAGIFHIRDAHMYCSDCQSCEGYSNGCSCREYDIIAPRYYWDI